MENRFIWHLVARDIHATHKTVEAEVDENLIHKIETLHYSSEKRFFDTKEELEECVAWHLQQYNKCVPPRAKVARDELYGVTKIDKSILPTYRKVFIECERVSVGETEYCQTKLNKK